MAGSSEQVPLDEVQDLVRFISQTFWLVGLDDAWTREAAASSESATRNADRVEQLAGVVDQMDQLYGDIGALAPRLAEIFSSRAALLRVRYSALVADGDAARPVAPRMRTLTPDERRILRAYVDEHGQGDIVSLATNSAYKIIERFEVERQNLRTEYSHIRSGGNSEGDIDPEFEAWLAAVALCASLALGPEAGGIVEAVGHAVAFIVDLFS